MIFKQFLILICILCSTTLLCGQKDSSLLDYYDFGGVILMDSIVVSASKAGFNVADFINMVRTDQSFYKAFRNIRTRSYSATNDIAMFSKKGKEKASYSNSINQHSDGTCRTMETLQESVSGNYYKRKGSLRYYTSKLFDQLFFTKGKVCESRDLSTPVPAKKGMAKHISELKKLIFYPGEYADVPFIGKKTAIFEPEMAKYYDFTIHSSTYSDSIDCYVFSAIVKPEFQTKKEDKTIIKSLNTYFEKTSFQVVARDYQLTYYGALFDFDVNMSIQLMKVGQVYLPKYLEYDGFWNVPLKKPEIAKFSAKFYDYK